MQKYIFGFMTTSLHRLTLRCIGKVCADFNTGVTNLIYNMYRVEVIARCR